MVMSEVKGFAERLRVYRALDAEWVAELAELSAEAEKTDNYSKYDGRRADINEMRVEEAEHVIAAAPSAEDMKLILNALKMAFGYCTDSERASLKDAMWAEHGEGRPEGAAEHREMAAVMKETAESYMAVYARLTGGKP